MTYKEKLMELALDIDKKANKVQEIESEFIDGFHKYSIIDYENALNAHSNAVNLRGELVSLIIKNNYSQNDKYIERN